MVNPKLKVVFLAKLYPKLSIEAIEANSMQNLENQLQLQLKNTLDYH